MGPSLRGGLREGRRRPVEALVRRRGDGFALLIVLWTLVLIAFIVAHLTASGRTEIRIARNLVADAVAEAADDGAIFTAVFNQLDPNPYQRWLLNGPARELTIGSLFRTLRRNATGSGKCSITSHSRAPRARARSSAGKSANRSGRARRYGGDPELGRPPVRHPTQSIPWFRRYSTRMPRPQPISIRGPFVHPGSFESPRDDPISGDIPEIALGARRVVLVILIRCIRRHESSLIDYPGPRCPYLPFTIMYRRHEYDPVPLAGWMNARLCRALGRAPPGIPKHQKAGFPHPSWCVRGIFRITPKEGRGAYSNLPR